MIAKAFELDRIYSEREVNIIIADFHDDFCTIRRDMVSERLLGRNGMEYWRMKNDCSDACGTKSGRKEQW